MGNWILGAGMGLLSLVGLFVASAAVRGTYYYVGLGLFALGVAAIFALIIRATRQPPRTEPTDPHYP